MTEKKTRSSDLAIFMPDRIEKSVSTLAIVPRTGTITRVARQAYTVMLLIAREHGAEDEKTKMFGVPVSTVLKGFDGEPGSMGLLKKHLKSMVSHVVEWQSPSTGESSDWGACGLLSEVRLVTNKGETWVHWSYPPTLRQEILDPKIFAQLQRETISKFRTHAGMALYEICARYKDNPSCLTSKQKWRWWLPVLTGKPLRPDSKTEFRFFNRDTLKPAIDEVNEVSEITVSVKEFRLGRSVEFLQFEVHKKDSSAIEKIGSIDASTLVVAQKLGIAPGIAEELLHKYQHEKFMDALMRLLARMGTTGEPIRSKTAYLKSILAGKEDLQIPASEELPIQEIYINPVKPLEPAAFKSPVSDTGASNSDGQKRAAEIRSEIEALEALALQELLCQYRTYVAEHSASPSHNAFVLKRIDEGKWQSSMVLGGLLFFYWKKTRGTEWTETLSL